LFALQKVSVFHERKQKQRIHWFRQKKYDVIQTALFWVDVVGSLVWPHLLSRRNAAVTAY